MFYISCINSVAISHSKQGDSDVNVAAITGGVVATVNILALTTVLVFLCLRYCYGPIPIKTLAKWALCTFDRVLSRLVTGPPINTSNNAAYEDVDLNMGGQNDDNGYEPVVIPMAMVESTHECPVEADSTTPQNSNDENNPEKVASEK